MRECHLKPAGEKEGMMRYVGVDVAKPDAAPPS